MPYVIRELLGPRSISTIHGKFHSQLRKCINPSFTPRAMGAKTTRLVQVAEQVCAEMAMAGKTLGEDAIKKFAFTVVNPLCMQSTYLAGSEEKRGRHSYVLSVAVSCLLPAGSLANEHHLSECAGQTSLCVSTWICLLCSLSWQICVQ